MSEGTLVGVVSSEKLVKKIEHLPFRIRLALTPDDIQRAVALRAEAYGRHIPSVGIDLQKPEAEDFRSDAILLMAESKIDNSVLGSVRLLTNKHLPLQIEQEVVLPQRFCGRFLLEARRLNVKSGAVGRSVVSVLFKAVSEICFELGVDEVLVLARRPVDQMYQAMQFTDVLDGEKINLPDVSNLPHGLYSLAAQDAEFLWKKANWPMYLFMKQTSHPDIEINYKDVARRIACCPHMPQASQTLWIDPHGQSVTGNCTADWVTKVSLD